MRRSEGYLSDFTLSPLLGRKGKNTALFFVYTVIVFLLASVIFYTHALKQEATIILQSTLDIVVQRTLAGRHDLLPVRYAEEIRQIRGVDSATPRLWDDYYDPQSRANFTLMVSDSHPLPAGDIIIGSGISRTLKIFKGDMMTFRTSGGDLLTLFGGVISGLAVGLLQPFAKVSSMKSFVPWIQKRLLLIALSSYVGFFLLAVYTMTTSVLRM